MKGKIRDKEEAETEYTSTVQIYNVALAVGPITLDQTLISVGTPIIASADFTDPGTADIHTAIWDWSDGTTPGTVTQGTGYGSITDSYTYDEPGVFTISLTVTDDDGGASTSISQFVVVYDPDSGFVTGGG